MNKFLTGLGMLALLSFGVAQHTAAQEAAKKSHACDPAKPKIVLVHGAFADASGFQNLIPLLQDAGYEVSGVQLPLSSLDDDIAAVQRVLEVQEGDVVLVGHSYGGAVISGAGNHPKVKALVYIAAFAPDDNELIGDLIASYPASDLGTALVPDSAGFAYIDRAKYRTVFAADLPESQTRVLAATQKPISLGAFNESFEHAAWHDLPSWYVVAKGDHAINPDLERFMAKRIGAITSEVESSHVPFLSQPERVSRVIFRAARSIQSTK